MANSNTRDADFWVFRDGRKKVPGGRVLRDLLTAVEPLSQGPITSDSVITALILAGELESALADSDCAGLRSEERRVGKGWRPAWRRECVRPGYRKTAASM